MSNTLRISAINYRQSATDTYIVSRETEDKIDKILSEIKKALVKHHCKNPHECPLESRIGTNEIEYFQIKQAQFQNARYTEFKESIDFASKLLSNCVKSPYNV